MAQSVMSRGLVLLIVGFSMACERAPEPLCKPDREQKTEEWCEAMMLKPNNEWVEEEFKAFSCDCL